jgi:hypothetical protein
MNEGPWFRARSVGRGWMPISWQGWLVAGLCVAGLLGAGLVLVAVVALRHH